jgi:hypothetical protein
MQNAVRHLPATNIVASLMCVIALMAFLLVNPTSVRSQAESGCGAYQCEYASECYDRGACRGKQRCHANTGGTQSWWEDDTSCDLE